MTRLFTAGSVESKQVRRSHYQDLPLVVLREAGFDLVVAATLCPVRARSLQTPMSSWVGAISHAALRVPYRLKITLGDDWASVCSPRGGRRSVQSIANTAYCLEWAFLG